MYYPSIEKKLIKISQVFQKVHLCSMCVRVCFFQRGWQAVVYPITPVTISPPHVTTSAKSLEAINAHAAPVSRILVKEGDHVRVSDLYHCHFLLPMKHGCGSFT